MPACFVRQTHIVITILTSLHADKNTSGRQQDPTWLLVIMHHRPHQLIVTLVCHCVEQSFTGFSFLVMPSSSLPMMRRSTISNQHQSLHSQMLHTCWQSISNFHDYGSEEKDAYILQ